MPLCTLLAASVFEQIALTERLYALIVVAAGGAAGGQSGVTYPPKPLTAGQMQELKSDGFNFVGFERKPDGGMSKRVQCVHPNRNCGGDTLDSAPSIRARHRKSCPLRK